MRVTRARHNRPQGRAATSCNGKTRHRDFKEAVKHAVQLELSGEGVMRVYQCRYCRSWRVGHDNGAP